MNITLFGNRFSGHSYKVALFLKLTNTAYTYEAISLSQPRNVRPASFRIYARFDEVPTVLIDGKPFVQSNAILLHLSKMLNVMSGDDNHMQVVEWLMWEQSRLGSSLPNLRYERKFIKNSEPAVQIWLQQRLTDDLNVLNQHLQSGRDFVVGSKPTIADCSLAGYLYWLEDAGFLIENWPKVGAWLNRLSQLEGWQHPDQLLSI